MSDSLKNLYKADGDQIFGQPTAEDKVSVSYPP